MLPWLQWWNVYRQWIGVKGELKTTANLIVEKRSRKEDINDPSVFISYNYQTTLHCLERIHLSFHSACRHFYMPQEPRLYLYWRRIALWVNDVFAYHIIEQTFLKFKIMDGTYYIMISCLFVLFLFILM